MMFCALLSVYYILGCAFGSPLSESDRVNALNEKNGIVAFYNMYAAGPDYEGIVQNQINTIKRSGLINRLGKIFYATMGSSGESFEIDNPKYVHIAHYGDVGEEVQTLSLLYDFCYENPSSKVLYFHDKGSYHHSYANVKICAILNCYVLNPYCIDALDDHDTCGWRISPTPFIHYSGNFWWARCSYINTLIHPMVQTTNQTYNELEKTLNECVGTRERYFAESWIGTAPTIHPADCMNSSIDTSYIWGYRFPFAADSYCFGPDTPSGLPCQTASTFVDVDKFKHAINAMNSLMPQTYCRDNRQEVIRRTQIMYGEDPHTYLEWMNELYDVQKVKDNELIRFTDSTQVYVVRDNKLWGFPNGKTFVGMGFDFDNIKVMYASDRPGYTIGGMLDSM